MSAPASLRWNSSRRTLVEASTSLLSSSNLQRGLLEGLCGCHSTHCSPCNPEPSLPEPKLARSAVTTSQILSGVASLSLCVCFEAWRESRVWFNRHACMCTHTELHMCSQRVNTGLVVFQALVLSRSVRVTAKILEGKWRRQYRSGGKMHDSQELMTNTSIL